MKNGSAMSLRGIRDDWKLPLAASAVIEGYLMYWIFAAARCGADECIDRPVVAVIVSSVWVAALALMYWTPGARPSERWAWRWFVALLWPVAAFIVLYLTPFDIVYD